MRVAVAAQLLRYDRHLLCWGRALDRAKLKCLFCPCPITPASLTGTVWKKIAELCPIQEALAARAACWLAICSFIFCCISLGVGCAMWVATIQV
jgi:hypothetical protein